jgi:hypothetical protein
MKSLTSILAATAIAAAFAVALPSCQTEMANIPGNAPLVASGTGNTTYTAAQSGTIYIYDKSWNKVVYSGDVKAGQIVRVDTNAGKVLVDNIPRVEQANVGGGSEFQFFLHPDPAMTTIQRTTTITGDNAGTVQRDTVTREVRP